MSMLPPDAAVVEALEGRHRAVRDAGRWLHDGSHLPERAAAVSQAYASLAVRLLAVVDVDDPELTRALSDLVRSRDSAVRAALVAEDVADLSA